MASEKSPLVVNADGSNEKSFTERMQVVGAILSLISIAVLKVQLTAFLFSYAHYPTAYSLWSCVVTDVLLVPVFLITPSQWGIPSYAMLPLMTIIITFTSLDLAFTNIALANISTALQQCIAATNPFWTIMMETILYRKCQHPLVYVAIMFLVVGALFASLGSIERMNIWGVVAACIAVLCSASKAVFTHNAFKKFKGEMGPLSLLFWLDLLMIPLFVVWTGISGELVAMYKFVTADMSVFLQMTGTAALGGVRALTGMLVLSLVTATSMSTANIFTQILNIIISIPIQGTEVTPALLAGVVIVICASASYTVMKSFKGCLLGVDKACGCAEPKPGGDKAAPLNPSS